MVSPSPTFLAAAAALVIVAAYTAYHRGHAVGVEKGRERAQREASHEAHEQATEREPPVDIGEVVQLGVKEFKSHHSGERVAVCKKQGFVVFVEGVPESVDVGDVVEAEVTSFGRERNSAEAEYVGRA